MNAVQPLEDKWSTRDFPVLVTAVRLLEESDFVDAQTIALELGFTQRAVVLSLNRLAHRHLEVADMSTNDGPDNYVRGVRPAGLEASGQWPTPDTVADRITAAIDSMLDAVPQESTRREKLVALRNGVAAAGRDVMVDVAAAVITGRLPI